MLIREVGRGTARATLSSHRAKVWLAMNSVVPPPMGGELDHGALTHIDHNHQSAKA